MCSLVARNGMSRKDWKKKGCQKLGGMTQSKIRYEYECSSHNCSVLGSCQWLLPERGTKSKVGVDQALQACQ